MSVVMFVGTDTGVGKTYVSCRALETLGAEGHDVVAVKPVESGCNGAPEDEDGVLLARATGQQAPMAALTRLVSPVTPALAAEREDVILSPERWCEAIRALDAEHEIVVVEGAGGVLSPLTWTYTALDFATQLAAKVVLVAADRLGAINHVLLSLRALDTARISTLGIVLSAPESPDEASASNLEVLRRLDPRPMTKVERNGDANAVAFWMSKA
jgi:dethiobiotin synthetase